MNKTVKKILSAFFALLIFCVSAFVMVKILKNANSANNISIVASNFAGYDFARAVLSDDSNVALLLKPGSDAHSYEPTPQDIINLAKADLFIYVGGESESWVEKLINSSEIDRSKTLRLMDFVDLKEEEVVEGMEVVSADPLAINETEYDEHIWTSPANAIKLVKAVRDKLIKLYPSRAVDFTNNSDQYLARLEKIDQSLRDLIARSSRRELIFADRFPFRYLVEDYGLSYSAAFPGCSEQTEASSATIAYLINKVRSSDTRYILKIELTSGNLAQTIANETGARILTLNSAHNVSVEDYKRGATYADFWDENLETLEKVLN